MTALVQHLHLRFATILVPVSTVLVWFNLRSIRVRNVV